MRTTVIFLCFISQQPPVQIRPNFLCRQSMTSLSFLIIRPRSHDVIFIMQIRAKFQILSSVNLNVKTFKKHSVIIAFLSYPHTLSKYANLIYVPNTQSACAQFDNFPLFCISATTCANASKFFVQIVYDQTIISYNKTKII